MSRLYYLHDSRGSGVVGDCMLWWRKGGNGYTTSLEEAAVFTEEQAQAQHKNRVTDMPWPKDYVDAKAVRHVSTRLGELELMEALGMKPVSNEDLRLPPEVLDRVKMTQVRGYTGLFTPYTAGPAMVSMGQVRSLIAVYEAARALLDAEGSLASAGVNPGPERDELEKVLREANPS